MSFVVVLPVWIVCGGWMRMFIICRLYFIKKILVSYNYEIIVSHFIYQMCVCVFVCVL